MHFLKLAGPWLPNFKYSIYRQGNQYIVFFYPCLFRISFSMTRFPLACKGKIENLHLLLCHCRYFDKTFTDMFLVNIYKPHEIFASCTIWLVTMATKCLHIEIKILKNHLLRHYCMWLINPIFNKKNPRTSLYSAFHFNHSSSLVAMATYYFH